MGFLFLGMFLVACSIAITPAHANDDVTPVFFQIEIDNTNEKLARKALDGMLDDAELELGRYIPLGLARYDLNDDGIKELFIRILEEDRFCGSGDTAYDCRTLAYAITKDGFVKIADFKAKGIDILKNKTNGTHDLSLLSSDNTRQKLIWQNSFYESTTE